MKKLSIYNKLKTALLLVCVVAGLQPAIAQSNLNFVRSWVAQKPIANEVDIISSARTAQEVIRMTEYVDGYGRPVQSVTKQASPALKDMVDMHVYDSWGREVQRYLPFTDVGNDGNYKTNASTQQLSFNQGLYPGENNYYYAQTTFENSPVNRPLNAYAPGANWVGSSRGVTSQYFVNTLTDNVRIWNVSTTQGALPTASTAYAAGQLFKTIAVDEQGNQTIQFQDKEGHVVLTKVQVTATSDNGTGSGHAGWLCTYYVYDDYNNLRYMIAPQVVALIDGSWSFAQALADELCVRYEYDIKNRVIIKKNPGAGEKWMVYDQRNRLVMSQDANQRAAQKWQYFQYDNLDRPVATGLMSDPVNYSNLPFHHANAANSIAYPNLGSYTTELLSQTYYDNYSWTGGTGVGSSLDASNTSNTAYFYSPSNTTFPYPQAIIQSNMTRGMITGSKTEVLNSSGLQYLYTVSFYDSKGRIIQTQGTNITGGLDKATTQYSWTGQTLRIFDQHAKSGTNPQTHNSVTKRTYDHAGRLLTVTKTMISAIAATNITSPEKTIATYSYNEAGKQVNKTLGTHPTTGNPLETMAYAYNLRGWLTGINKNYTQAGSNSNYFGMDLAYDKTASAAGTTTFSSPVYNGNMAGLIWKSKGDGVSRKYDFAYDKASRLTGGNFVQNTSGSTWDNSYIDYSVLSMSYNANSNISTLYQHGFALGASSNIDELSYNYEQSGASNKLKNVIDNANYPQSKIGDFHYAGSKIVSQTDYLYDGNGNKTSDANKNISSIAYNLLNLPRVVTITGKGTITYTYDAAGNKLKKEVQENNATVPFNGSNYVTNITTVTTYIGAFEYQSKTFSNASLSSLNKTESLQYVLHEEGRARVVYPLFGQPAYFAFDYFVRDNLGNVRVTLSDEQQQDTYPAATLESGGIATEQSFYNIVNDANHVILTSSLPWWSTASGSSYQNNNGIPVPPDPTVNPTASSTKVYKLNGATGDRFGMGISLKVMAGDVISIFGRSAWHSNGSTNNTSYNISAVLTSFINAFAGTNAVVNGSKGVANATVLNNNANTTGPLTTLLNGVQTPVGQTPKAYINWILFDEQFKPVTGGSGVDPINAAADVIKAHSVTGINIVKSGYLYIYCSNESNQDVYFDNLQVIHTRGALIEERHYYPNGLTMFAISNRAFGKLQTNFGYQGKDFQGGEFYDGTGLEEYDFVARFYDPQLGRWWTQDPAGQFASPYTAMANNWPSYVDRDGRLAWFVPIIIGAALFGAGNLAIHAARGDIDNFWDGLGYFVQGAVVGAVVGATWSFALAALNGSAIVGGSTLIQGMGFASQGFAHTVGVSLAAMKAVSTVTTLASIIANPENAGRILMGNAYTDENRTFLGGIVTGISRFTWEGLQTWVGYNVSQIRNTFGGVDRVDYMAGATYVTGENRANGWGVSLGNFLNISIPNQITGNFENWVTSEPLFMHEYGHTTDSRLFGPLYLFAVGIPSAAGAEWTEIRANRFGAAYFGREYGVNWAPFEAQWPRRR